MSNTSITSQNESHTPLSGVRASLIHWLVDRSEDELAEIWVDFNRWNWPTVIPEGYQPKWWKAKSPYYNAKDRQTGFITVIMDYCKASVSDELIDAKWMERTNSL